MDAVLERAVLDALQAGAFPDIVWNHEDDKCDCVYQRIGFWTNPYLAETLEVRMCCIWADLYKSYPDFVRTIPAYWNQNAKAWEAEAQPWNGEADMPKSIWYRQLARQQGRSVADIRAEYQDRDDERPRGKQKSQPCPFLLKWAGDWIEVDIAKYEAAEPA